MPACALREIVIRFAPEKSARGRGPSYFGLVSHPHAKRGFVGDELLETVRQFPLCFRRWAGSVSHFTARAAQVGRRWLHGVRHATFADAARCRGLTSAARDGPRLPRYVFKSRTPLAAGFLLPVSPTRSLHHHWPAALFLP